MKVQKLSPAALCCSACTLSEGVIWTLITQPVNRTASWCARSDGSGTHVYGWG